MEDAARLHSPHHRAFVAGQAWPRRGFIAAATAVLCTACAGAMGPPERVLLSEREIERLLQQRFPLDTRAYEVLDVRVEAPRLRLLPERNRIAARVDLTVRDRLFGSRRRAEMAFDAVLKLDPREQTLRLGDAYVSELVLREGVTDAATPLPRIGAWVAERLLEGLVIYTLPPEQRERLHRQGVAPGAVTVQREGVEIRLVPASSVAPAASAARR